MKVMTFNWQAGGSYNLALTGGVSVTLIKNQVPAVLTLNDQGGENASGGWQDLPDLEGRDSPPRTDSSHRTDEKLRG